MQSLDIIVAVNAKPASNPAAVQSVLDCIRAGLHAVWLRDKARNRRLALLARPKDLNLEGREANGQGQDSLAS